MAVIGSMRFRNIEIDIGSTNCVVAVAEEYGEIDGSMVIPCIIALGTDNQIVVGERAKRVAAQGRPALQLAMEDLGKDQRYTLAEGKSFSMEEILGAIFSTVKIKMAQNLSVAVTGAVVTYPVWFGVAALESLRFACEELGGIPVLKMIPDAVAVVRTFDRKGALETGLTLVYHLGGRSCTVALVEKVGSEFSVLSEAVDLHFGGTYVDTLIARYILGHLREQGYSLSTGEGDRRFRVLMGLAEKAKCDLSVHRETWVRASGIFDDDVGQRVEIDCRITQRQMEQMVGPFVTKVIQLSKSFLAKNGLDFDDLANLIAVGGSSAIPSVRERLEEASGRPLASSVYPPWEVSTSGAAPEIFFRPKKPETFLRPKKPEIFLRPKKKDKTRSSDSAPAEESRSPEEPKGRDQAGSVDSAVLPGFSSPIRKETRGRGGSVDSAMLSGSRSYHDLSEEIKPDYQKRLPFPISPEDLIEKVIPKHSNRSSRSSSRFGSIKRFLGKIKKRIKSIKIVRERRPRKKRPKPSKKHAPAVETEGAVPGQMGGKFIPTPRIDRVHFSVITASEMAPDGRYHLDVWAHLKKEREELLKTARDEAPDGQDVQISTKGPVKVGRGAVLTVMVRIEDWKVEPLQDTIEWEGEAGNAHFIVTVPKKAEIGRHTGTAYIHIDGFKVVQLSFLLLVGEGNAVQREIDTKSERFRSAFASYASADRDAVMARIQGILKAAPDMDIFLDVQNLRSGQKWGERLKREILSRDVLYLFWSKAASKSKWVKREWKLALKKRGIDFIDPVPLVSPEVVPPPKPLRKVHFNDWMLAYMRCCLPSENTPLKPGPKKSKEG